MRSAGRLKLQLSVTAVLLDSDFGVQRLNSKAGLHGQTCVFGRTETNILREYVKMRVS